MTEAQVGRVLVTGAAGFVGRALVHELTKRGISVTASVRRASEFPHSVRVVNSGDLTRPTDWTEALFEAQAVVHCAARVHVMRDQGPAALEAYRSVNVEGSVRLARAAAATGARRFVFLSSIKASGELTEPGQALGADAEPRPRDPYGESKLEAERALAEVAAETGMQLVIVRPPLVYGPGVRANFLAMSSWIARGVPLPFGGITANRRSFVALDNLLDLIAVCLKHPAATGRTFHVCDGEDLSTTELLRRTARAMNRVPRLLPIPASWLELGSRVLGRPDLWQRLGGSMQVDMQGTRDLLGWSPPIDVNEGLRRAVFVLGRVGQAP